MSRLWLLAARRCTGAAVVSRVPKPRRKIRRQVYRWRMAQGLGDTQLYRVGIHIATPRLFLRLPTSFVDVLLI